LGKVLGSGAFGEVFPAKHKQTGWIFALKKIKKASVKHMLDQFIQEIKIQLFLDHPNIVKLYSFFDDDLHFYILMEYMEEGSLYSYLKKKKTLTLEETSLKLREVCEGL
jgi:aurora kinase